MNDLTNLSTVELLGELIKVKRQIADWKREREALLDWISDATEKRKLISDILITLKLLKSGNVAHDHVFIVVNESEIKFFPIIELETSEETED